MKTLTIRIDEKLILKELEQLKLSCFKNTDSGLIKYLIFSYGSLQLRNIELQDLIGVLEDELEQEQDKRDSFTQALSHYISK